MAPEKRVLLRSVVFAGAVQAAVAEQRRLRIHNACRIAPIWIAHEAGPTSGPDPQNRRIDPEQYGDFITYDGLSATRYWPKMFCNDTGDECGLGGSGGPGQACVIRDTPKGDDYSHCAPPIDTKFEATFGSQGRPCSDVAQDGCDFIDISLVDGFTLPFKLEMRGPWCSRANRVIDCSALSFAQCPASEWFAEAGVAKDLRGTNPKTGKVAGCYSPCSKLTIDQWNNSVLPREDPRVAPYCCPIPPSTPEACRAGPVKDTAFVKEVHSSCPGVYGYSFDDAEGLMKCHPSTQYVLTFYCPAVLQSSPAAGAPAVARPAAVAEGPRPAALRRAVPPGPAAPRHHWAPRPGHVPAEACQSWNGSCAEHIVGRRCQCGHECVGHGNCCPDFKAVCQGSVPAACKQRGVNCAEHVPGRECQCSPSCMSGGTCCPDYDAMCAPVNGEEFLVQKDGLGADKRTGALDGGSKAALLRSGARWWTPSVGVSLAAIVAAGGVAVGRMRATAAPREIHRRLVSDDSEDESPT